MVVALSTAAVCRTTRLQSTKAMGKFRSFVHWTQVCAQLMTFVDCLLILSNICIFCGLISSFCVCARMSARQACIAMVAATSTSRIVCALCGVLGSKPRRKSRQAMAIAMASGAGLSSVLLGARFLRDCRSDRPPAPTTNRRKRTQSAPAWAREVGSVGGRVGGVLCKQRVKSSRSVRQLS